jgi:hypothetical protein
MPFAIPNQSGIEVFAVTLSADDSARTKGRSFNT